MSKHVLAIQPQLAIEPGEHEENQVLVKELWNQEQEVHARAQSLSPEYHRERLHELMPFGDIKKLVL